MLMDIIKSRHSIRKYTEEQISREDLEKILEAGNYAPNAGGGQRSVMVAIHNKEIAAYVGKLNMKNFDRTHLAGSFVSREQPSTIDDPTIDAFCMMENMILRATEEGRMLMREWEVPEGYECQGFVILGHIDGEQPQSKPRKPGRIRIVE